MKTGMKMKTKRTGDTFEEEIEEQMTAGRNNYSLD
jgi:hypothetical protein